MRFQSLFPLAACLAFALPISAHAGEWPAGAKASFLSQCESAAGERVGAAAAKTHCECSEKAISSKMSSDELKSVANSDQGVDPALQKKMMDAAQGCRTKK
ncbi:MAG: hypothetical protein PW845_15935 [Pseudomonas sp.]|uniref:hypothetical protein n=1 Tax=Pseudomonas abieticivorans TaxID=2931382 RepID=UPI0020BEBF8B|nr:hypothetical protein [Pseudomonas sp. PIA16]MDE1166828.1 hypothetical protein [Pseudomonas sp.]